MPDFGEVLVDIREHFADLPFRVSPVSVFTAVILESMGSLLLRPCGYRSPIRVPNFDHDLDTVKAHFETLRDLPCTADQIDQAQDALRDTLMRFQARIHREHEIWFTAARAGMFLGTLIIALLFTSALMCFLTDHLIGDIICLAIAFAIELIAGAICLRHWHYRRP